MPGSGINNQIITTSQINSDNINRLKNESTIKSKFLFIQMEFKNLNLFNMIKIK